jgi:phosphonate transport system substrate-binding protein
MAFVPSQDTQKILAAGRPLAELLTKQTGYKVDVQVPTAYAPVVEGMGAGRVDVAWLNTFSYVLARKKYGVEVILATVRQGSKTYLSQVITHVDSGINRVDDLRGKKFAFVDPLSTSGYIYIALMIKEKFGVEPAQFFRETVFAGGHPQVVIAVYNKQVDGGATFGRSSRDPNAPLTDARVNVQSTLPDVLQKVKIVTESDPIPNDTVSVRRALPKDVVEKVRSGLLAIANDADGKKLIKDLYNIDGLAAADEKDYAVVVKAADLLKIDLERAIQPAPTPTPRPAG